MKIICVDDEPLAVEDTLAMCRTISPVISAAGFTKAEEALEWLRTHPADIALLDINMPRVNGITLAEQIRQIRPETAILFLTAYKEYAFDAFSVHPTGYLLKPVMPDMLKKEIDFAVSAHPQAETPHIEARTFGNFALLIDGKPVRFKRSKSKELLAYLIDRQGRSAARREIFAALFEDMPFDRSWQKYLDAIIRSLRDTLREYGIEELMQLERNGIRIVPEKLDCDMYRFYRGEAEAIRLFRGEYLSSYGWASMAEADMRTMWEKQISP